MSSPEDAYIKNIDAKAEVETKAKPKAEDSIVGSPPFKQGKDDVGIPAQGLAIGFFNDNFNGEFTARHATPEEDSGVKQIERGKQIDAVIYDEENIPVMCAQITTARDEYVRREKVKQLLDRPFVRIKELKPQDLSLPKVLINMDPVEVGSLLDDHDPSRHPKIFEQIIKTTIESLKFVLTTTKYDKEQERIKKLIDIFEKKRGEMR